MKFTPSLFLTGLLMSISSLLFAQSININTAKEIAKNHLLSVGKNNLKSASPNQAKIQFSSLSVTSESKDTLYFVLNDTTNHSFVIVAADKRSRPIIGYSLESSYNANNQPPAFVAWMENRKKEIESIKKNNLQPDSATTASWQNLSLKSSAIETTSVEPLIQTQWDQGCYYNELCPSDTQSPYCGHTPTGCVATAMAQIMKYWNYPTSGKGSHSYLSAGYGVLKADFGSTTYQWSQMPNQVTSENEAVAKLMLHCGISVDMRYGPGSSGSYDPRDELVEYFNYSPEAENVDRKFYLESDWLNLLKTELDYGRPIWYQGTSSPCLGGHAFVCDGYQNSDYFHFNWGWGGSYDGYFYLGNLNPGSNSFSLLQSAIIKISPNSLPDGYNGFLLSTKTVGIGIKGGTAKIRINSSKEWKALSDQSWLAITPDIGTPDNNTITFNASANPTTNNRTANVIISAPGLASQTITVTQYGKVEVSSGNLKTILSSQLSAITNLTLSGTIDARDFKTMRDEMPALTDIDLSDVVIVEYSGLDGTISEKYTYSANAIPRLAFRSIEANLPKTRLKSIVLPPSITSIDDYAFMGCKNLTIEEIPKGVTSIGDNVFSECNCTTALTIPASVTFIGKWAFNCFNGSLNVDKNNPNYSSLEGILFDKSQSELIQCPVSKKGNYTIPSTVTTVGLCAFDHCIGLTAIIIPSSVISIKEGAFRYCTGLTSLNIPSTVTSIELRPFSYCSGLLYIDDKNPNYSAIDGVFFNKNQTELISCPVWKTGTYTIPSKVTAVFDEAFHHCDSISTIIVPSEVKSIGIFSFSCIGLSSLYVYSVSPVDLSSATFAFDDFTTSVCKLYVPYGTKSLYAESFQWKNFRNIVEIKQSGIFLSNTSTSIRKNGGSAFVNISSSEDWSASSDQAWLTINPVAGYYDANTITLTAPANPTTSMRKATVTISATGLASQTIEVLQYGNVEVTAGNLKSILSNQLSTTTDLTLSGTIDARDFRTMRDDMPALTEINLSDVTIKAYIGTEGTVIGNYSVTYLANEIPRDAFFTRNPNDGKYSLKSITLPQTVKSIGSFAFGKCTSINSFEIPSSVTSIDDQSFYLCKGLINVETNNSNYSSQEGVLFNKDKTTLMKFPSIKTGSYIIPSSVETIKGEAFAMCDGLTSITIPSSVTSLEYSTFYLCSNLKSINIPSSVISIGIGVFSSCKNLATIEIPSSVISIGSGAFGGCAGLNSIIAHSKLPVDLTHSSFVFSVVNIKTCTLYVPYGAKSLYSVADQWEDFVNIVELPNQAPVANAGLDQTINGGKLVTLNSTGSTDAEGNLLTYKWTAPTGITLNSTTVSMPTFAAPDVVTNTNFTFSLVVNDGVLDSPADQVIVTVTPDKAPTANAGTDQSVNENIIFRLDGTASSDPDNDELTYQWTAPAGITLSSNTTSKPTFTAPEVTTDTNYTFSLVVNDGSLNSTADQIVVTVKQVNKAPTANAGTDQTVNENSIFTLDGTASSDPDNDELTYAWTAPAGITLSSTTVPKPTFTAPEVTANTNYTFSLVVNDGTVDSPVNQVVITVKNLCIIPALDTPSDVITCDSYILPLITGSNLSGNQGYYDNSKALGGKKITGPVIHTQKVWIYDYTGTNGEYFDETSFIVTINHTPEIANPGDIVACDSYTLPVITGKKLTGNQAYFDNSQALGGKKITGPITSSQTVWIYDHFGLNPDCSDETSYKVTIFHAPKLEKRADQIACDSYILPPIKGSNLSGNQEYYDNSKALGGKKITGPVIHTQKVWIYDYTGTNGECFDETSFTVTINHTPEIANPGDIVAFDSYTLPVITGKNLTGNEAYYDNREALGHKKIIGPITSSQTVWIYDEFLTFPNCSDETSFKVTINYTPSRPPLANAGIDQTVNEGEIVVLDGLDSSDPDGNTLTYKWTAPAGIALSSITTGKPTFIAPEVAKDTLYTFSLVVNDGSLNSTADQIIITVKNVDKAPYLKNPIKDISVDKRAPDQTIDLQTVFADDDLGDVLSYIVTVTNNKKNQLVTIKIAGSYLTLSFSSQNTGLSEIVITANSNGKEVTTKFNVEVKIPTGIDPLVCDQNLILYPNPTNGKIKIISNQIPQNGTELIVTDITGKTILKQIIQEKEGWIDLTGNPPGIYLLKTNLGNTNVQKMILE